MDELIIQGGRLIDPGVIDGIRDIYISNGKIADICLPGQISVSGENILTVDASGMIVSPGLIDMHVHFREPGGEHKETIATGCQAAAAGGFTGVCTMPNTNPVNDHPRVTEFILKKTDRAAKIRVYPVAAISQGLQGDILCDYDRLKKSGAIAVSDDGQPVMNSLLMRKALETAGELCLPVISHSEDHTLIGDGVMNEGPVARKLGYPGIPNSSESIMVMRDIALAELTRKSVHIAHVSTKESVRAIRDAKNYDVPVTAETAPHYFTLSDQAVEKYGTNAKMNPPLRSGQDREAVRKGLADGTIDVIATDHAPHTPAEKANDFKDAPNGIIGLETSVPLCLRLVRDGVLDMSELILKMSQNPARILGLETGLKIGLNADLTIIDPAISYTINAADFYSLARNTPFDGWNLTGKIMYTIVNGRIVFQYER